MAANNDPQKKIRPIPATSGESVGQGRDCADTGDIVIQLVLLEGLCKLALGVGVVLPLEGDDLLTLEILDRHLVQGR
jgi:hypothetical protein